MRLGVDSAPLCQKKANAFATSLVSWGVSDTCRTHTLSRLACYGQRQEYTVSWLAVVVGDAPHEGHTDRVKEAFWDEVQMGDSISADPNFLTASHSETF